MILYRSKPILKKAVQWKGNNMDQIEDVVGSLNIQGEYEPSQELLIKQNSGNFRLAINDWVIVENDTYFKLSDNSFKANYTSESVN